MSPEKLGRLSDQEEGKEILHDSPEKQMEAVMSKLDEITDALQALAGAAGAGAGISIPEVDDLKKIILKL